LCHLPACVAFTIRAWSRRTFPTFCANQWRATSQTRVRVRQLAKNLSSLLSSCVPSWDGLPNSLVMRHLMEVCSLPAFARTGFAWDDVAWTFTRSIPIHPITGWPSLAPSSSTRRPISLPCGAPSPWETFPGGGRRAYHVLRRSQQWVRSRLSAGGASSAVEDFEASTPDHVPFGSSLSAPLACLH
jgi:hypothetical protein